MLHLVSTQENPFALIRVGFVDDLFVDRLFHVKHVLQVTGEFLLLEKFLSVVRLVPYALILDFVDKCSLLAAVDCTGGKHNELLRIAPEGVEAQAVDKNSMDAAAGEPRPVMKLGEQIRQFDIGLFEYHGGRPGNPGCFDSRQTDGYVRLVPLQVATGDWVGVA